MTFEDARSHFAYAAWFGQTIRVRSVRSDAMTVFHDKVTAIKAMRDAMVGDHITVHGASGVDVSILISEIERFEVVL